MLEGERLGNIDAGLDVVISELDDMQAESGQMQAESPGQYSQLNADLRELQRRAMATQQYALRLRRRLSQ